jgi:hypothetical protein
VTVVVTDICPDGAVCGSGKTHFDLSGAAFDSIASPGRDADLRKIGIVPILFQRYLSSETTPSIWSISIVFKTHSLKHLLFFSQLIDLVHFNRF